MAKEIKEQAPEEVADNQESIPEVAAEETVSFEDAYKGWIKMSHDEMVIAQDNGTLMGWHPAKKLGLVKVKETKKK